MKREYKKAIDFVDEYEFIISSIYLAEKLYGPTNLAPYSTAEFDSCIENKNTAEGELSACDPKSNPNDLRGTARKMYVDANELYRKTNGHVTDAIQICSGLRTVKRQSELYEDYLLSLYGGPPASKANKPGKSYHEYGLAIDVIRNGDEGRIKTALESAGWVQAIVDEGWHFQAEGAAEWGEVSKRIVNDITPLSEKYAQNRVVYYENKKRVSDAEPAYLVERLRLNEIKTLLNNELVDLNQERNRLQAEQFALRQTDADIKTDRLRVQDLKSKYTGFIYDRCPAGRQVPYDQCTHEDLKRQFDKEKNAIYLEFQNATRKLVGAEQRQAVAWKRWNDDTTQYRGRFTSYQERLQQYEQDRVQNDTMGKKIDRWRKEMNVRNSLKTQDLDEVIAMAAKI
jgi:hypothetical protein